MVLRVQTQISGHVIILNCEGRIVFGDEGAALHERIRNLLTGTTQIVINLRGVDHIDSGGIGVLVGLFVAARNRGGELKLVSPNKHVYDTLRRTSLDAVFRVYGNDEEAVAAFRKQAAWRGPDVRHCLTLNFRGPYSTLARPAFRLLAEGSTVTGAFRRNSSNVSDPAPRSL